VPWHLWFSWQLWQRRFYNLQVINTHRCFDPIQPPQAWLVFSETANLADWTIYRDFPSLRLIGLLGGKIGHWRLIPADSPTFESEALHACELLLKCDARFGRIPQSRQTRAGKPRRN
jgi:hypothetical protein